MQTERVTFLTSADHKAALDAFAAKTGQSVGHVVREATSRYIAHEQDEEAQLAALVAELAQAVPDMKASLERTAQLMEDTIANVDRKLREAGVRR
jgi:predicted transcriptional regulator